MKAKPLPSRDRNWLREVQRAYEAAQKRVARGDLAQLDVHVLAPRLAAKNRGVDDPAAVDSMVDAVVTAIEDDAKVDDEARYRFKFNFVWCYVFAHEHMGFLSEREADILMDYLNTNLDLFDNEEDAARG